MTAAGNRFRRRRTRGDGEVRFGRMLAISLVIHGLVVLLSAVAWQPALHRPPTEIYRVELVYLPVAVPQRGRPTPAVVTAPERPAPPVNTAATKAPPLPPPRKTPTKAATKTAPLSDTAYDAAQDVIERMQRKQEIAEVKQKLKELLKADTRKATSAPTAPAGAEPGKDKDPGSTYEAYIRQFLKEAWTLSKYQVGSLNLAAEVSLTFDAHGTLTDYRFLRRSGETRFDESVQRAVLDLRQLPTAPGQTFSLRVTFNLKELLER